MAIASELKQGMYFLMNGEPAYVKRKELVAVGTHSHTKIKVFYSDIYGKGEKSANFGHTDRVEVLDIVKKTGQLLSKSQKKAQLMDMQSYETFEADAQPELLNGLNENDEVIFIDYNGSCRILEKKKGAS
ncbi:hypothetical protein HYU10_00615 [Candidatus Woesearchaeota archaeon]|nr:hypothetical protein [Candidatus Woesearchaeota archaeon]